MPDLIRGYIIRGRGDYGDQTDDGAKAIDEDAIERDWIANFVPRQIVRVAKEMIEETDHDTTKNGDVTVEELECVELRNTILRFIEDVENLIPEERMG